MSRPCLSGAASGILAVNKSLRSRLIRIFDYGLILGPLLILSIVGALGGWWYLAASYDMVISGGRVIDPETGMDRVMYIGINNGKITALSEYPLFGQIEIPAKGKIVGPGFIDVSAHSIRKFDQQMALLSGVTTVLDNSVGTDNMTGLKFEVGRPYVNFGSGVNAAGLKPSAVLQPVQFSNWISRIETQLKSGGGAIIWNVPPDLAGFESELMPLVSVAIKYKVPLAVQFPVVRSGGQLTAEVQRLIDVAQSASINIILQDLLPDSHIFNRAVLAQLTHANDPQIWYTFSPYSGEILDSKSTPYSIGDLRSAQVPIFDFDSGERIRMNRRRWPATVIVMVTPMSVLNEAVLDPQSLVASDSQLDFSGRLHPRYTGTFARILRKWVVGSGKLSWVDAFRLMSERPAGLFSRTYPQLKSKGKISVGADADIVIIDPKMIEDWGTYQHPVQPSRGVIHVIVNGRWVVKKGQFMGKVRPGEFFVPGN